MSNLWYTQSTLELEKLTQTGLSYHSFLTSAGRGREPVPADVLHLPPLHGAPVWRSNPGQEAIHLWLGDRTRKLGHPVRAGAADRLVEEAAEGRHQPDCRGT